MRLGVLARDVFEDLLKELIWGVRVGSRAFLFCENYVLKGATNARTCKPGIGFSFGLYRLDDHVRSKSRSQNHEGHRLSK